MAISNKCDEADKRAVKCKFSTNMFHVLWITLILNSVLKTKQVYANKVKVRNDQTTSTTHLNIPLYQKLRNTRKKLRNERRYIPKDGIDSWGYEDISEPLQYNYREVWWTKDYPIMGEKKTTIKPANVYHRDLKDMTRTVRTTTTEYIEYPPSKIHKKQTQPSSKIVKHSTTKVAKKPVNLKNIAIAKKENKKPAERTIFSSSKRTTKQIKLKALTEKALIQFTDENKGRFYPVFKKGDKGQFSLLANNTNVLLKRNENDSDIHGSIDKNIFISNDIDMNEFDFVVLYDDKKAGRQNEKTPKEPTVIEIIKTDNIADDIKKRDSGKGIIIGPDQSAVLPNIVKDGIYRIEIPEPVTIATTPEMNLQPPILQNYPSSLPRPPANKAFYNNGGSNIQRPGPYYNQPNVDLNGQSQKYYTKRQPLDKRGPFYNPKLPSLDRNGQFYNMQNPGLGPNYFQNTQNMPNPQNLVPYTTHSPGGYMQSPSYNAPSANQGSYFSKGSGQAHFYNTRGPVEVRQGPELKIPTVAGNIAPGWKLIDLLEDPTKGYREEIETSTYEKGGVPKVEDRPVFFDDATIAPLSPYVRQLKKTMEELNVGYFSIFLIKLFEIVAKKEPEPLRKLFGQAQHEASFLFDEEQLLAHFGEPFGSTLRSFADHLDHIELDFAKHAASMLHYAMVNRRDGITLDINSVIDYIDSLYEDQEGVELLKTVEIIEEYPNTDLNRVQVHRRLSKALYEPVKRLTGTSKRQILFDSLNKVIENHSMSPESVDRRKRGNSFNRIFNLDFIKAMPTQIEASNTDGRKNYFIAITNERNLKNILANKPTIKHLNEVTPKNRAYTKNMKQNMGFSKMAMRKKKHRILKEMDSPNQVKKFRKNTKFHNNHRSKIINKYTTEEYSREVNTTKSTFISKTTHLLEPITEKTEKNKRFAIITSNVKQTDRNSKNNMLFPKENNQDEQRFIVKDSNKTNSAKTTDQVSIKDNSIGEEEGEEHLKVDKRERTPTEDIVKETTTIVHSREISKSITQPEHYKHKKKHSKTYHLNKKQIRHLRHKHPKIYKKYLRHLKRGKHKKSNRHHKKKNHHSKKKRRKNIFQKIKNIEHHYENVLKHHILKKTHLKARELDNTTSTKNNTIDYSDFYDSLKSTDIHTEFNKDTTPNFAFMTPQNPDQYLEDKTENWFYRPIETKPQISDHNVEIPTDQSIDFSQSLDLLEDDAGPVLKSINDRPLISSSYSDEEDELKFKLHDAMRHDQIYFRPGRRFNDNKPSKNKLNKFSSYSSEEAVLKTNIYKAVEFNKYHTRANFSDIIKRDDKEKTEKNIFRSRIKTVNEMTSYSDEEDILKQKLKL